MRRFVARRGKRSIAKKLTDADVSVRQAALAALAAIHATDAVPAMIAAAADPAVRFEAMQALAECPIAGRCRSISMAWSIRARGCATPRGAALITLRHVDRRGHHRAVQAARTPQRVRVRAARGVYLAGADRRMAVSRFVAQIGACRNSIRPTPRSQAAGGRSTGHRLKWQPLKTDDPQGRISLHGRVRARFRLLGHGLCGDPAEAAGSTEFTIGSDDQAVIWVNGRKVYEFTRRPRAGIGMPRKVDVALQAGVNHIWFMVGNDSGPWEFSLNTSRRDPQFAFLYDNVPAKLDPSAYRDYALKNAGDPEPRPRTVHRSQGGELHQVPQRSSGMGGKVGPDLAGIAAKYPRDGIDPLGPRAVEPDRRRLSSDDHHDHRWQDSARHRQERHRPRGRFGRRRSQDRVHIPQRPTSTNAPKAISRSCPAG